MKTKFNFIVLSITMLFIALSSISFANSDKIRGMFVFSSTVVSQGIPTVIDKMHENGVGHIYLLVKGTNGIMIDSTLLANFITAAHNKNMEVHAWYGISQDAVFFAANPDAVIYHSPQPGMHNNQPYPMTGDANSRLNFLYPGYKEYVLGKMAYLLTNFNLDGIHLDNIRYHHLVYSFDQYHIARANGLGCNTARLLQLFIDNYAHYSGAGWIQAYVGGDVDIVKWVDMRKDVLAEYINAIKTLIQQLKPGIELSASFTPELNNDAMVHYSQDYTVCSPYLDRVMPQTWFQTYGMSTTWIKTVTENVINLVTPNCKVTASYQITGTVTTTQLTQQLNNAIAGASDGVVGARYDGITTLDNWNIIKDFYLTVIPVELTSFSAQVNAKGNVFINWSTATELNNHLFEIQRRVEDSDFISVGFVKGNGTTAEPQHYSFTDESVTTGKYYYRLKQIDFDGAFEYSNEIMVDVSGLFSYELGQNYPNPFNPSTVINFSIADAGMVKLAVYNLLGEEVQVIKNEIMEPGFYQVTFDALNLPTGMYIYKLETANIVQSKKMVLLK